MKYILLFLFTLSNSFLGAQEKADFVLKKAANQFEQIETELICSEKCKESDQLSLCHKSCLSEESQNLNSACSLDLVDSDVKQNSTAENNKTKYIGLMQIIPQNNNVTSKLPYFVFSSRRKTQKGFYRLRQISLGADFNKKVENTFDLPIRLSSGGFDLGASNDDDIIVVGDGADVDESEENIRIGDEKNTDPLILPGKKIRNEVKTSILQLEYLEGVEFSLINKNKYTNDIHIGLQAGINASLKRIQEESTAQSIVYVDGDHELPDYFVGTTYQGLPFQYANGGALPTIGRKGLDYKIAPVIYIDLSTDCTFGTGKTIFRVSGGVRLPFGPNQKIGGYGKISIPLRRSLTNSQ